MIEGGVKPITLKKIDFKLGVTGEDQDTSRHFEGGFGSMHAILQYCKYWVKDQKPQVFLNFGLKIFMEA